MPDGDQYNGKLKYRHIQSYKMLCEDKFAIEEIQRKILENIRKSIRSMGDGVFENLKAMVDAIRGALHAEGLSKAERCQAASRTIDQARGYGTLSSRDYSMLSKAAKSYIHDVRYGNISAIGNEHEQILSHCFHHIYEAEFKEPVGQIEDHHNGIDHMKVMDKLSNMDPGMRESLFKLAKAVHEKQSTKNVRLPRIEKKAVSIDENLL